MSYTTLYYYPKYEIQVKVNYLVDGPFYVFIEESLFQNYQANTSITVLKITKDVNLASTLNSIMKNVSVVISQEEVVIIDYFIDVK